MGSRGQTTLYNAYEKWKGWEEVFAFSPEQALYFKGETRDCKIVGAQLLEIGFGSGSFLAWAMEQGARVVGTEINETLLSAVMDLGIEVMPANFEQVAHKYANRFDTVAAFDVFEHFSLEEIITRLKAIETMLNPGGHLILRFPNGQSPFGLAPQYGDPTHKSVLSGSVFEQLTQQLALDIVRYGGSYRVTGGGLLHDLVRRLRYFGRNIVATIFNFVYAQTIPWDPVVVLVLRKPD